MRSVPMLSGLAVAVLAVAVLTSGCGGAARDRPADASSDGDGASDLAPDGPPDAGSGGPRVIRVTTTSVVDADDGACSLSEALAAASGRGTANADCTPATAGDDIELPAGTYETTMMLELTESIEIRGAGMTESTILFDGGSSACGVRLATAGKMVRLTSLTLRGPGGGGVPGSKTGACVTAGELRLRHARVSAFSAGGVRVEASPGGSAGLAIYNSLIDANTNPDDGGGVALVGAESALSIDQSSIVDNASDGAGGGVFVSGGSNATYIFNTTISGNVARRGGGVAARIPDLTYFGLYWSTVADNRALEVGGGLDVTGASLDAHGTATASIVAANSADGDAAQANLNADWPPGFSCTSSILDLRGLPQTPLNIADSCRFDVTDIRLGPLMDMGGVDHLPIHALLPGSPAIDAADSARPSEVLEQRDSWNQAAGDPPLGTAAGDTPPWTVFGGDADLDPAPDLGAYEAHPRWEAELLPVVDRSAAELIVGSVPGGASHGAAARLLATAAGQFVTFQVPVPEPGQYAVSVRIATGSGAGMFQLLVSDAAAGPPRQVGDVQDGFSASPGWTTLELGDLELASAGQELFTFSVTGRRAESSGYGLVLDYLTVTRR